MNRLLRSRNSVDYLIRSGSMCESLGSGEIVRLMMPGLLESVRGERRLGRLFVLLHLFIRIKLLKRDNGKSLEK